MEYTFDVRGFHCQKAQVFQEKIPLSGGEDEMFSVQFGMDVGS